MCVYRVEHRLERAMQFIPARDRIVHHHVDDDDDDDDRGGDDGDDDGCEARVDRERDGGRG